VIELSPLMTVARREMVSRLVIEPTTPNANHLDIAGVPHRLERPCFGLGAVGITGGLGSAFARALRADLMVPFVAPECFLKFNLMVPTNSNR
jgi:hypothetical protein